MKKEYVIKVVGVNFYYKGTDDNGKPKLAAAEHDLRDVVTFESRIHAESILDSLRLPKGIRLTIEEHFVSIGHVSTLGFGHMGNGIVVWDTARKENNDYLKVATIDSNRKLTFRAALTGEQEEEIRNYAYTANPSISATQNLPVFKDFYYKGFKWKKKIGDTHAAGINGTLCGIPMLGNNYADQNEPLTCSTCIEIVKERENG